LHFSRLFKATLGELAANTSLASLAGAAWPALSAQQLPTVAGTYARIVTPSDKGGTIERNNVEPLVLFTRVVCATDIRRSPIATIATSTRDADPIGVRWRMQAD
jgi:hypothetical protein